MGMPVPRRADLRGTWGALWASAACHGHLSFTFCAETHLKMPLTVSSLKSAQGDGALFSQGLLKTSQSTQVLDQRLSVCLNSFLFSKVSRCFVGCAMLGPQQVGEHIEEITLGDSCSVLHSRWDTKFVHTVHLGDVHSLHFIFFMSMFCFKMQFEPTQTLFSWQK